VNNHNDLVTPDEMIQITGCKLAVKQCDILRDSGVRYIKRHDGRPMVTWTAINNTLSPLAAAQNAGGDGFDLGALTQ